MIVSPMHCQHIWMLPYNQPGETANSGPIYSSLVTTTAEQKLQMQENSTRARNVKSVPASQ